MNTNMVKSITLWGLLLILAIAPARASLVVFAFTNSLTGMLDTNSYRLQAFKNVRNADGSYNVQGPPVTYQKPTGYGTNWLVPNFYYMTNPATGFWDTYLVLDASSNLVWAGNISLHQSANPFVVVNFTNNYYYTNSGGAGANLTNGNYTLTATNGAGAIGFNLDPSFIPGWSVLTNGQQSDVSLGANFYLTNGAIYGWFGGPVLAYNPSLNTMYTLGGVASANFDNRILMGANWSGNGTLTTSNFNDTWGGYPRSTNVASLQYVNSKFVANNATNAYFNSPVTIANTGGNQATLYMGGNSVTGGTLEYIQTLPSDGGFTFTTSTGGAAGIYAGSIGGGSISGTLLTLSGTTAQINSPNGSIFSMDTNNNIFLGLGDPLSATGVQNVGMGASTFTYLTTGQNNVALGGNALNSIYSGTANTALGYNALVNLGGAGAGGSNNIAIGVNAGNSYSANESSNILIGAAGVPLENNIIRIGEKQTKAYLAGQITGNGSGLTNLNASQIVTLATNQLYDYAANFTFQGWTNSADANGVYTNSGTAWWMPPDNSQSSFLPVSTATNTQGLVYQSKWGWTWTNGGVGHVIYTQLWRDNNSGAVIGFTNWMQ